MKFKLKCIRNDDVEYWTYDNVTNVFLNPEGKDPLEQFHIKDYERTYPFWGEDNETKIKDDIQSLYIVLGHRCNFSCKYCQQTDIRKTGAVEASPALVDPLVNMISKSGLHFNNVVFWGGEPMVYWKTMKPLIEKLRIVYPDIPISFVTNGSLFDEENSVFLAKYGVSITISYDGQNTLRDYPVFNDPKVVESLKLMDKTFQEYNNRRHKRSKKKKGDDNPHRIINILPCISETTSDVDVINEEVKEKLGFEVFIAFQNFARCISKDDSFVQYVKISEDKRAQLEERVFNELNKGLGNSQEGLTRVFDHMRDSVIQGLGIDTGGTCGASNGREIAIDMKGNILSCMGFWEVCGHISNYKSAKYSHFYSHRRKEPCLKCHLVNFCHGICIHYDCADHETSNAFKYSCENAKAFHNGHFRALMSSLFGVLLQEVTPIEE